LKNPSQESAGRVAQSVGLEFTYQSRKKKKWFPSAFFQKEKGFLIIIFYKMT
jgi:hypothetical protein